MMTDYVPNEETKKAIKEVENGNLQRFETVEELMKELNKGSE